MECWGWCFGSFLDWLLSWEGLVGRLSEGSPREECSLLLDGAWWLGYGWGCWRSFYRGMFWHACKCITSQGFVMLQNGSGWLLASSSRQEHMMCCGMDRQLTPVLRGRVWEFRGLARYTLFPCLVRHEGLKINFELFRCVDSFIIKLWFMWLQFESALHVLRDCLIFREVWSYFIPRQHQCWIFATPYKVEWIDWILSSRWMCI